MFDPRLPEERIDRYAGPYERWVLAEELGGPFAFPAARPRDARHMTAILDNAVDPRNITITGAEVRLPPLWPSAEKDHAVTPFAFRELGQDPKTVDRRLALRLGSLGGIGVAPRVRLNLPLADACWVDEYRPEDPAAGWRRPGTPPSAVLGVIDDGMPFAHRAFLGAAGRTRISHLWLQSARGRPRDRVPFGRELSNGEIDAFRQEHGGNERRLYRMASAIDEELPEIGRVLDRYASHGAHILGLAAGNGPPIPAPTLGDDVQIVAVQLPNTVAWDTSGFGKEMFMLSALHYIFVRAAEIARAFDVAGELPLVVNFSYGWSAGRHDGQSEMEVAIEEMLDRRLKIQPATAVVLPVGNTFAKDLHASFTAADFADGPARIGWRLPPDDRTSSYLEIWLPAGLTPNGWEVRVEPPPGIALTAGDRIAIAADVALDPVGDPRRFVELEIAGANVGQLSVDHNRGTRWRVMLAMAPTAETGNGRRLPSGLWHIVIDPGAGAPLETAECIDLWVQRDDDPPALQTGGRQSRLEGGPGLVRGFGSLSAIATTPSVTRVAGFIGGTFAPAPYSSAAALRTGNSDLAQAPDLPSFAAPADQGAVRSGLPSIGVVSGSHARLAGTSAAAALASRWMAANAAAGLGLTHGLKALPAEPSPDKHASRKARLGDGLVSLDLSPAGWSRR